MNTKSLDVDVITSDRETLDEMVARWDARGDGDLAYDERSQIVELLWQVQEDMREWHAKVVKTNKKKVRSETERA